MMEEKKKIAFVVNPISGVQDKSGIVKLIDEEMDRGLYDVQVIYTEFAGHASQIAAQQAEAGAFAVVAVGGDGTVNEIARSLTETQTAMGIVPCGSGNGLARHLQISMHPKKAIQAINAGKTEYMDYGTLNDQKFFCTCGVGFDAFVSLKFAESGKRGPLNYVEKALRESLRYKPETYELEVDGSTTRYKAYLIACGNAAQYGNNAYIAPRATLNDGLLDVTILEPFTIIDVPSLSFQLFNKTIDQNNRIKTVRCKNLCIHRQDEGVVHVDGDPIMMGLDLRVGIVENGLKVIVPAERSGDNNFLELTQEILNNGLKQLTSNFEGLTQRVRRH